jgi:hypothetical protein
VLGIDEKLISEVELDVNTDAIDSYELSAIGDTKLPNPYPLADCVVSNGMITPY